MKRSLITLCLLFVLSLAALGGEVNTPGKADPTPSPTPCDSCQTTTTATNTDTSESDAVTTELLWILAGLMWP